MYHHPAAPTNKATMTTAMTFGCLIISTSVVASCRLTATGVNTSGSSSTSSGSSKTRSASRTSASRISSSLAAGFGFGLGFGAGAIVVSSSREKTTSFSTSSISSTGSACLSPTSLGERPDSSKRSTKSAFLPDVGKSLMTQRALSLATVSEDGSSVIHSP